MSEKLVRYFAMSFYEYAINFYEGSDEDLQAFFRDLIRSQITGAKYALDPELSKELLKKMVK